MRSLSIHAHIIEDDDERDLIIADGVIAAAEPIPGIGRPPPATKPLPSATSPTP
jgi:hypothetical protein